MMTLRILFLTFFTSILITGCADDEPSPEESVTASVEALVGPVDRAIDNPTGRVDADTAVLLFDALAEQETIGQAMAFVPGAAPGASPQNVGGHPCIVAADLGGTIDIGCMTNGEVTGRITYQASGDAALAYVKYTYDAVCSEGVCIDGSGGSKVVTSGQVVETTLAGDFDITDGEASYTVSYGYKMTVDGQSLRLEYVVFVDGESYVVTWDTDGSNWVWTIRGAGGTYRCEANQTESGWSGACTGAGSFEF